MKTDLDLCKCIIQYIIIEYLFFKEILFLIFILPQIFSDFQLITFNHDYRHKDLMLSIYRPCFLQRI